MHFHSRQFGIIPEQLIRLLLLFPKLFLKLPRSRPQEEPPQKGASEDSADLEEALHKPLETVKNIALNERDYGELSGLNKDESREKWGEEQIHIWRRSFDQPPPGGESLKDTADRVIPYFEKVIEPVLNEKKNLLGPCLMHYLNNILHHLMILSLLQL